MPNIHVSANAALDEAHLHQALDELAAAFYITDADGKLTYCNRAASMLSGHMPDLGTDQWRLFRDVFRADGACLPADPSPLARALGGRQIVAGEEYLGERHDGSRVWFLAYPTLLRDEEGRVAGASYLIVKLASAKTRGAQTDWEFRTIFDTTPECVKIVDAAGKLLQMNRSGLAILGENSSEAVVGKSVYDIVAPEDRERYRAFNDRICRGERDSMNFEILTKNGGRRQMETHAAPLIYNDGQKVQLSVTRDVSEQKQAERAKLLLSAIVDSSDDAIVSKDLNGVITSWNKSAERLFGYTAEEAIGQPVLKLLIPEDRQEEEPNILARLRRGERVDHFETKRRCKSGELLDISLTISPVRDSTGKIIGASKVARDITEQRRSQEALRKANQALTRSNADLEQFAYSASHDLQEPLRMISAYSELLRRNEGEALGATGAKYLSFIQEGALRMDQLLRDLRMYTQTSLMDPEPAGEASADVALHKSLANLRTAIEENDAEIRCDVLPPVRVHEFQLEQLFQNVVANALRYRREERPLIQIGAEPEQGLWRFFVQDNGIGIAPDYKEQVFGIFKRLHTAAEYPGTGMGLAICQRIVERAGGRIWVESQPGRGSTFFFTLPAAPAR